MLAAAPGSRAEINAGPAASAGRWAAVILERIRARTQSARQSDRRRRPGPAGLPAARCPLGRCGGQRPA
jgi:hypothetical protein